MDEDRNMSNDRLLLEHRNLQLMKAEKRHLLRTTPHALFFTILAIATLFVLFFAHRATTPVNACGFGGMVVQSSPQFSECIISLGGAINDGDAIRRQNEQRKSIERERSRRACLNRSGVKRWTGSHCEVQVCNHNGAGYCTWVRV